MTTISSPPALHTPAVAVSSDHNPRGHLQSSRRPSWILSIGAKLSSRSSSASADPTHHPVSPSDQATTSAVSISVDGTTSRPPKDSVQSLSAAIHSTSPSPSRSPATAPPNSPLDLSASPKQPSSASSFFSSAIRRLSSSRPFVSGSGGLSGCAPSCAPRRVLNVNHNRVHCAIPELGDAGKLRRVSFCVDVKIAGPPSWSSGSAERVDPTSETKEQDPSTQIPRPDSATDLSGPGATHIQALDPALSSSLPTRDVDRDLRQQGLQRTVSAPPPCTCESPSSASPSPSSGAFSPRRWRRPRSSSSSASSTTIGPCRGCSAIADAITLKSPPTAPANIDGRPVSSGKAGLEFLPEIVNKPTTDPLRIYRRCCQLRETPVLKRIADQLSAFRAQYQKQQLKEDQKPSAIKLNSPPVVPVLDLSNSCLQHSDFITLADWLAIVPVKRLILENADIRDGALRAVLSGLLAVKPPHSDFYHPGCEDSMGGVVECLNLCRNRHLSAEGWKHISLFLYLCTSLKAIDLSYIPFPQCFDVSSPHSAQTSAVPQTPPPSSGKHGRSSQFHIRHHHAQASSSGPATPTVTDPQTTASAAEVLGRSLCSRRGGSTLEEVRLGNCGLTASIIKHLVDAAITCGVHRLSLAGNKLDATGLHYATLYAKSGVCQGLDLASNDIRAYVPLLANCFREISERPYGSSLWALCLSRCNLDGRSLQELLPELSKLPNVRFLDLSHNKKLMTAPSSASLNSNPKCLNPGLAALRKWLPQCKMLRRLHLADIALTPAQAMTLMDVIPDIPTLGFLDLKDNPALTALAEAETDSDREEAYALFASLAAAARASRSILRIDIALPSEQNGEVVKALARQAAAACLRNVSRWTEAVVDDGPMSDRPVTRRDGRRRKKTLGTTIRTTTARDSTSTDETRTEDSQERRTGMTFGEPSEPTQSDALLGPSYTSGRYSESGPKTGPNTSLCSDLVSDCDSTSSDNDDGLESSSDSDYYSDSSITADNLAIRAPGVTKALDFFLSEDIRHPDAGVGDAHASAAAAAAGVAAPRAANEMNKYLLSSARRIRARLQIALKRAAEDPAQFAKSCGDLSQGGQRASKGDVIHLAAGGGSTDAAGAGAAAGGANAGCADLPMADFGFRRLKFMDHTLEEMIDRFESEFPECKRARKGGQGQGQGHVSGEDPMGMGRTHSICLPPGSSTCAAGLESEMGGGTARTGGGRVGNGGNGEAVAEPAVPNENEEEDESGSTALRNRRNQSDVSFASRVLMSEEGEVHRIGTRHGHGLGGGHGHGHGGAHGSGSAHGHGDRGANEDEMALEGATVVSSSTDDGESSFADGPRSASGLSSGTSSDLRPGSGIPSDLAPGPGLASGSRSGSGCGSVSVSGFGAGSDADGDTENDDDDGEDGDSQMGMLTLNCRSRKVKGNGDGDRPGRSVGSGSGVLAPGPVEGDVVTRVNTL